MTKPVFKPFDAVQAEILESVQTFARLSVTSLEKVAELQVSAFQTYADLVLGRYKDLLEVKDAKTLEHYVAAQSDVLKTAGDMLVKDTKSLTKIGLDYHTQVQQLAEQSFKSVAAKAA